MAPLGDAPIAIVGLGVIGGSAARALVREGLAVRAYAPSGADAADARRAGIDVAPSLGACLAGAQIALIAVPLDVHAAVAVDVVGAVEDDTVVLHAGSLQSATALRSAAHRAPDVSDATDRIVGTHPFAGSHRSGFAASRADLFAGCVVYVEERADAPTRAAAEAFWRAAGAARFEYRPADEHDQLMTWVSHLPQLASTALAYAIGGSGVSSSALGPGGRDATRLAASPFSTWSGILAGARGDAARAVAALERSAGALRAALEQSDMAAVERMWTAARSWRDVADSDDSHDQPTDR